MFLKKLLKNFLHMEITSDQNEYNLDIVNGNLLFLDVLKTLNDVITKTHH